MTVSADKLVVVALSRQDWAAIVDVRSERSSDRFDVNLRESGCTLTPRLALVTAGHDVQSVGLAHSRGRSGDLDKLIRVAHLYDLEHPVSFDSITRHINARSQRWASDSLALGGVVPDKTAAEIARALVGLRPELADQFARLKQLQRPRGRIWSNHELLMGEQRDALAVGLEAAGIDSRAVLPSELSMSDGAPSFLSVIEGEGRASEAAIIRHDHHAFEDWPGANGRIHDVVEFVDPMDSNRRVTAIYADKEGIERVTGTDLVYYRHHEPGFVLVQYKRMEHNPSAPNGQGWGYRPDRQLDIEIERMRRIAVAGGAADISAFRLSPEPFYLKLVPWTLDRPEGNRLAKGMYFPLGLFELLLTSPDILGPMKGKRIGWHNARRHLTNTEFVGLLRQGWIGSTGDTTATIADLLEEILANDRGAVVVRNETPRGAVQQ